MKNVLKSFLLSAFALMITMSLEAQSNTAGFNFAVDSLVLSAPTAGGCQASARVQLEVYDTSNDILNMSFDLQFYVNGKLKKTIGKDVRKNGAIQCAVTCNSNCGSIFGDGVCGGCKCNYGLTFSTSMNPSEAKPGDVIEVRLVPARNGVRDDNAADNTVKKTFAVRK